MTQFIISFGGMIPSYHAGEVLTCHPSEAQRFNTIDEAEAVIAEKYPSFTHPASIRNADTLEWVKTPNW